jgi:hypothetical protein
MCKLIGVFVLHKSIYCGNSLEPTLQKTMKSNQIFKLALAFILFSSIGCGGGGGGGGGGSDNSNNQTTDVGQLSRGTDTAIRLMHGTIDATPLTLRTGTQAIRSGRFAQETFYSRVSPGELLLSVERANTPSVIAAEQVATIEKGKEYTALITGSAGALMFKLIEDTTVRPGIGLTSVRLVNSLQGLSGITAELSGVTFPNVSFGGASGFLDIPSGVATLTVKNQGGAVILSKTVELLDQADISILVTGSNSLGAVFAVLYRDLD